MLKSSTGRVYALLAACKPNDAKVKKRLLLSEIFESNEFKALQVCQGAQFIMDKYYSPDILSGLTYRELEQVKTIVPFLEDCINKTYSVISYGDTNVLKGITGIDFYNVESVKSLYERVKNQPQKGVNITNISEIEMWEYFDERTIKSLDGRLRGFTEEDYEMMELRIPNLLNNVKYCISCVEITARRDAFRDRFRGVETQRIRRQIVENKAFAVKSMVSLVLTIGMASKMYSTVDMVSNRITCMIIYFFVLILYWLFG